MKKVMILILSLFSVTGLVSCEEVGNRLNLINHLNTMASLDTYVMEFDSVKHQISGDQLSSKFIYIDNDNSTFMISDRDRDIIEVEQGDVVFQLNNDEVFGSVEAVKTVSDLFMPLTGEVIEFNEGLEDEPEIVNKDPYGKGWMIKIAISDSSQIENLLDAKEYQDLIKK